MSHSSGTDAAQMILCNWWRATGDRPVAANPGEGFAQELERRHRIVLPEDFRGYLLKAAPATGFWDNENGIWWAPDMIKNMPDEFDRLYKAYPYGSEHQIRNIVVARRAETYLFFADYLVWSSAWAICCDDGPDRGKVVSIDGVHDRFVASSFTTFVTAYVADPTSMF